jgi:integrase
MGDADVIEVSGRALVPSLHADAGDDTPTLENMIAAWLHEKRGASDSARTEAVYRETLADYRDALLPAGLDLDSSQKDNLRAFKFITQGWAARPRKRDGRPVSAATHNQRLAVLASFYTYAHLAGGEVWDPDTRTRRVLGNPAQLVKRRKVRAYESARALKPAEVAARLAQIDRCSPAGLRDFALLALALNTGRRAAELAGLVCGDLEWQGEHRAATVTWRRCKGGKLMRDDLDASVTAALVAWLSAAYRVDGDHLESLGADAPVWIGLGPNVKARRPLSTDAIADVCQKRLGTSKIHATRHSFADGMNRIGAPITAIQARLGHNNLATTSIYLPALQSADNPYAEQLAAAFGIGTPARTSTHRTTQR